MADKRNRITHIRCDAYNDDPLRVSRVAAKIPNNTQISVASSRFSTVAHPVRLTVLFALEQDPLCVCELSCLLEMSAPAMMHHIQKLAAEGQIDVEKRGKFAEYYLTEEGTETLAWARELFSSQATA